MLSSSRPKPKPLALPTPVIIRFREFLAVRHFQYAAELDAAVASGLFLLAKMAIHHGADFQRFAVDDLKPARLSLAVDPGTEFSGLHQGNALPVRPSFTLLIALHKALDGIGPQVEGIVPVGEKRRGDFPGGKTLPRAPDGAFWPSRRQNP